jgi:hypothetical protein
LAWLERESAQTWVTAVERPPTGDATLFHVEQGQISPMI